MPLFRKGLLNFNIMDFQVKVRSYHLEGTRHSGIELALYQGENVSYSECSLFEDYSVSSLKEHEGFLVKFFKEWGKRSRFKKKSSPNFFRDGYALGNLL